MDVWRISAQLLLLIVLCSKLAESRLIGSHSPTFPELQRFPLKDGYINIAEEIASDYKSFGSFILYDGRGSKVAAIAKTEHDPVAITLEILRQWLQGKGRMPVTWLTLIKCLRDTGLNVLADDIKSALSQEAFEYSWIAITGTAVCGVIVVIVVLIQKKCGGNTDSSVTPEPCATSRQNVSIMVKSYPPLAEHCQGLKAVDEEGLITETIKIQSEFIVLVTKECRIVVEGVTDLQCGSYHFSQQRGLPRALPGLEEVTVESVKEETQYQSREFQDPSQVLQGQGFHIVTYNILSYLDDARSLCRAEQVCNDWYQIICKGLLWKKLIERMVKTDSVWRRLSERRGWNQYLYNHSTPSEEMTSQCYKQLYTNIIRDVDNLQINWKSGDYTLTRIECHSKKDKQGVWCLQYDDNKIVSGHWDSTIKIWDCKSLSVTRELLGHTDGVRCLQYDDRVIVTGSYDSTIRVWDVNDGSLVNRLDHHGDPVLSLKFNSDTLVTGSSDETVAVWDMISPMDIFLRKELTGHTGSVNAVDFDENYIVSGSADKTIKVWQTSTGELVHTLHGHRDLIWCLQYRGKHIVSGSNDSTIRIWDIDRGACLRVLEGHSDYILSIRFDDRRIVSGDYLGVIKVWDFQAALDRRSQDDTLCLQTLREHSRAVYSLQFDDFQIISGSDDDGILIWDFLDSAQPGYMQTDQSEDKKALT